MSSQGTKIPQTHGLAQPTSIARQHFQKQRTGTVSKESSRGTHFPLWTQGRKQLRSSSMSSLRAHLPEIKFALPMHPFARTLLLVATYKVSHHLVSTGRHTVRAPEDSSRIFFESCLFIQTVVPKHLSFFLQSPSSKHTPPVSAP